MYEDIVTVETVIIVERSGIVFRGELCESAFFSSGGDMICWSGAG